MNRRITVLIPAHNEGHPISAGPRTAHHSASPLAETLLSLHGQRHPADRIVVISDNSTDDTVAVALAGGVEVYETVGNTHKKAGALNQWLDSNLSHTPDDDLILVMDADSILDPGFIENALRYIAQGYTAVGGIFLGKDGGGLVGWYQRNEFARYARDVARRQGRTLVLTGTATVFVARALKDVVAGRLDGRIPDTGEYAHVYDIKALTEDNELTFALLHLGHKIIAPPECTLTTEVMETWSALRRQRFRWKRGAIENNHHYGLTRYTLKYHALQWWSGIGIFVTAVYLASLVWAISVGQFRLVPFWLLITAIYVLERVVTVRARGPKQMLLAGLLVVEMPYDIVLQFVQAKAFFAAAFGTKKNW